MPCAVAMVSPARPKRTRGLTAGASEAQEITISVAGSSPQVRWICSGVPSGLAAAALLAEARLPAAVASPEAPASLRKPRRETVATCSASGISSMFLFDMSGVLVLGGKGQRKAPTRTRSADWRGGGRQRAGPENSIIARRVTGL